MNPETIDNPIAFYHNPCQDGLCCAYIIQKYYTEKSRKFEMYGLALNNKSLPVPVENRNVMFFDIAPNDNILDELTKANANVFIIDHHKTNKQKFANRENVIFDDNFAGCVLTWKFFYKDEPVPLPILMIQDRDIWKWEVPNSEYFCDGFYNYGYLMENNEQKFALLDEVINSTEKFNELITFGKVINAKKTKQIENIANYAVKKTYNYKFGEKEYTVCIVNCDHDLASDLGNYIAKNHTQFSFVALWRYSHDQEEYWLSLRSVGDIDVAEIAKKQGGGGHKNAAGFTSLVHPSQFFARVVAMRIAAYHDQGSALDPLCN